MVQATSRMALRLDLKTVQATFKMVLRPDLKTVWPMPRMAQLTFRMVQSISRMVLQNGAKTSKRYGQCPEWCSELPERQW